MCVSVLPCLLRICNIGLIIIYNIAYETHAVGSKQKKIILLVCTHITLIHMLCKFMYVFVCVCVCVIMKLSLKKLILTYKKLRSFSFASCFILQDLTTLEYNILHGFYTNRHLHLCH